MRLRRRSAQATAPPLSEDETLLALLGDDAPLSKVKRMMWQSAHLRDPWLPAGQQLWELHGDFLLREAKRRGIPRPPDGFAAEGLLRSSLELQRTWEEQRAYREAHGIAHPDEG